MAARALLLVVTYVPMLPSQDMRTRGALLAVTVVTAIGSVAWAAPAVAQGPFVPGDYCVPSQTQYDPQDLRRPNAPPINLPRGYVRHRVKLAGYRISVIERGPRNAQEAVVLFHGNPGNSLDWLGVLRSIPKGTRVIAFDLLGFGASEKPWNFPYTFAASRPLVDRVFKQLRIRRVHLIGSDVGSIVAVDYAARHPRRLGSAVLLAGGILIGYQDHHIARIWKTPLLGEENMRMVDREGFVSVTNAHNPRPVPREFYDRNYDYFDRETRCAILKLYRAQPDLTELGKQHAAALRPYNRPALVIFGEKDPFIPAHIADENRRAFPRARIHIFQDSGHWPYVDAENRTVSLMRPFLRRHVREQKGKKIRVIVKPRVIEPGKATRLRIKTVLRAAPKQPVAGAVVKVRKQRKRTGYGGHVNIWVKPGSPGRIKVKAWKRPLRPGRKFASVTN